MSDEFGDRYSASQFGIGPPDDGGGGQSGGWQPSGSDLLAIGALLAGTIMWIAQPTWQIGVPTAVVVIGIVIFAASRHPANAILRTVVTVGVISIFIWAINTPH